MSEAFKGIRGGDPSMKPAPVMVVFPCTNCGTPVETMTTRPKAIVPTPCSEECARDFNQALAKKLIKELLNIQPNEGHLPQNNAKELIQAHEFLIQAKLGRLRALQVICARCNKSTYRFIPHSAPKKSQNPLYCSWECRDTQGSLNRYGKACRTPNKHSYENEVEAATSAERLNLIVVEQGDTEGVIPYSCDCGSWHIGHYSKHEWFLASKQAIVLLNQQTLQIAKKPNPRNRQRKQSK